MECSLPQRSDSDSRAGILVLSSLIMRARLVKQCVTPLSMTSGHFLIRLVWMLCYSGIAGNYKANELARKSSPAALSIDWERVDFPSVFYYRIADGFLHCRRNLLALVAVT